MISGKRGEDKYLSPYNFLIFVIIIIMVIAAIAILSDAKNDVRQEETKIITNRVIDCLTQNSLLNEDALDSSFDLLKTCKLNARVINESNVFYIKVSMLNADTKTALREPFVFGNKDFEDECAIKKSEKQFAACRTETLRVSSKSQPVMLEIFVASDNKGETA